MTDKFKPDHLRQLNFYLEALDRDVKKQNENPSIGAMISSRITISLMSKKKER
jgi:hypothetical protein